MPLPLLSDQELDRIKEEHPSFIGACPTCNGTGFYTLYGIDHDCNCLEQVRLTKAYYSANIGSRFHVLGWDDFQSLDREVVVPVFQEYVEHFQQLQRYGLGLTLSGPPGTGKTLALTCTMKDLIKQGHSCYFVQGEDLVNLWGASWSEPEAQKRLEQQLKRVEVLSLDDLRTGATIKHTKFVAAAIEGVIRHRYNHSLPTLITTNLELRSQRGDQPMVFSLLSAVNAWHYTKDKDARTPALHLKMKNLALNGEVLPVV